MRKLYLVLLTVIGFNCYSQVTLVKGELQLYSDIFEVNGNLLFAGDTGTNYNDLWVSDGTTEGTRILQSYSHGMAPFMQSGSGSYTPYVFNNALYFLADSDGNGYALWKSDGTEQGTAIVKYFGTNMTGPDFNSYPYFCVLNNELLFAADDGVHGVELWKTDGTNAGTVLVKDIATDNNNGSEPSFLTLYDGLVYFSCYNETYGVEIWKTDGTAGGTEILKDILPGTDGVTNDGYGGSIDPQFTVSGNYLFFTGNKDAANSGYFLYRTDGTAQGTMILDSLNTKWDPGSTGKPFQADVNGVLMYIGNPAVVGANSFLYKSDGTPAGTVNVATNDTLIALSNLFSYKGKLYFHGAEGLDGVVDGLCVSDGMTGGTSLVESFPYVESTPEIIDFVDIGNSFFFNVELSVPGLGLDWQLAQSDGTAAGTIVYGGATPVGTSAYYNGSMYFAGLDTATSNTYSLYKVVASTTLGIPKNEGAEDKIMVFPNPAGEIVTFSSSGPMSENARIKVFNFEGENIYSNVLMAGSSKLTIDVSQWSSGIYLCTLLQNSNMQTLKIIIQH